MRDSGNIRAARVQAAHTVAGARGQGDRCLNAELDLWRLAAGLGLFLFGMHQLETSLKLLTGRPFKKFLREHTAHPVKGVLAGAVSTAALQSSSVVSLIVLAFVGTGIISLASAIGIVFGSNLGTTATGWIVATVGFKLDIESLALPLVAIGGLTLERALLCLRAGADIASVVGDIVNHADPIAQARAWIAATRRTP